MSVKLYKLTSPLEEVTRNPNRVDEPIHVERVRKVKSSDRSTFDFDLQYAFNR